MRYILDTASLRTCDIILTRSKNITSKSVRFFSAGDYSHALCCLTATTLIEATVEGRVFTENPQRLIFENIDDCKVLRLKSSLSQNDIQTIISFLQSNISISYSLKEAVLTRIYENTDILAKEGEQFCSRLVAQAFRKIGVSLVKNPDYCTPESLNSSELLEVVPNAIREATIEDIRLSETPSQIDRNRIETHKWLEKVTILAKKENFKISDQNSVTKFLVTYPQYDKKACKYIKETSYLTQYKQDEVVNPWRYKYLYDFPICFDTELSMNKDIIKRHITSYSSCCALHSNHHLSYFSLLKNLYKNLLRQSNNRLNILKVYMAKRPNMDQDDSSLRQILSDIDDLQLQISNSFKNEGYKSQL